MNHEEAGTRPSRSFANFASFAVDDFGRVQNFDQRANAASATPTCLSPAP
jgi:hypothetical protein